MPSLPLILAFGIALFVAIKIARALQREVNAASKKAAGSKRKRSPYHWVWGSFHWIWAGVIPLAKYVYREWKTAPPNSAEKFLWTMLLALTGAVVLWILMKIVDRLVNREPRALSERKTYTEA